MTFERSVLCSCAAFVVTLIAQLAYVTSRAESVNDLYFPICAGRAILKGIDPYGGACTIRDAVKTYSSNPLTAVVAALPFAPFGYLGALTMWSCFVGVLVFGLLRCGQFWRFLIMTSAPFWHAFWLLQWSPLLTAVVLVPVLLPIAMVKPQLGLPIILTHLTVRRGLACVAFGALTLAIDPNWPGKWWLQAVTTYDGFIPVRVWPYGSLLLGLLVFVVLVDRRDWRAPFLLLSAFMPQRGFYDALPLGTVARTAPQLLAWSALSWVGYIAGSGFPDRYMKYVVVFVYFPIATTQVLEAIKVWRTRTPGISP